MDQDSATLKKHIQTEGKKPTKDCVLTPPPQKQCIKSKYIPVFSSSCFTTRFSTYPEILLLVLPSVAGIREIQAFGVSSNRRGTAIELIGRLRMSFVGRVELHHTIRAAQEGI